MVHKVIKEVDSTRLRNYHKELTKAPHIAGLRRDQELTGWIKEVIYFFGQKIWIFYVDMGLYK